MIKTELDEILQAHKKWLDGDADGRRADLIYAHLNGADLRGADLSGADFRYANLRGADLSGADLRGADLRGAYLSSADLIYAHLNGADLSGADLRYADLRGADLIYAHFNGADLSGADLRYADLRGADLSGAYLSGAKNIFLPINCPETGEFEAFKKAANNTIVKLKIPKDAKRSSATTRKCRCDKAIVLSIEYVDGRQYESESVHSIHDTSFIYTVGEEVSVPNFDDNRWNECAPGIHFFITRDEAVLYQ